MNGKATAKRVLVTGGAGFIGSNFVRHVLKTHSDWTVTVVDLLTYAGNMENLRDLLPGPRIEFVKADIVDQEGMTALLGKGFDYVFHFAAETHVDRSIQDPQAFIRTDVIGTYSLLEAVRRHPVDRFVHVSTDEVYGSLSEGSAGEDAPLMPTSPYAASKAGADRLAFSYHRTYGIPIVILRPSNNFGPHQHPEKLIPLFITNALTDRPLPLYGDGLNVRDWLYVRDHCEAIDLIAREGETGAVYNIGAESERTNLEVTEAILDHLGKPRSLIKRVKDRPGHDRRYSVDWARLKKIGWTPGTNFRQALRETIDWYVSNQSWWKKIKSGEYAAYYEKQYGADTHHRPSP
ncbi:MAG: dTDP-glucose 4,6-dehydratase [Acidobacteriota bacterium]